MLIFNKNSSYSSVDLTKKFSWEIPKPDYNSIHQCNSEIIQSSLKARPESKKDLNTLNLPSASAGFTKTNKYLEEKKNLYTDHKMKMLASIPEGDGDSRLATSESNNYYNDKAKATRKSTSKKGRSKSRKKRRSKTNSKGSKHSVKKFEKENFRQESENFDKHNSTSRFSIKSTAMSSCPQLPMAIQGTIKPTFKSSPYLQNHPIKLPNAVVDAKRFLRSSSSSVEKKFQNENLPIVCDIYSSQSETKKQEHNSTSLPSSNSFIKGIYLPNEVLKKPAYKRLSAGEGSLNSKSLERRSMDHSLKHNSLKDRLNLIHCYGSDYASVTKQYEAQKRKEIIMKQHQDKMAEKLEADKKKQLQRKKIYALNSLMTKLEHSKFEQFMANRTDASRS